MYKESVQNLMDQGKRGNIISAYMQLPKWDVMHHELEEDSLSIYLQFEPKVTNASSFNNHCLPAS
jgi:hypothetical protein